VTDSIVTGVFVAVALVLVTAFAVSRCAWEDECRAKGGTPYCAYKSSCVCLKPGTVIE
jgi:hypothetical protein